MTHHLMDQEERRLRLRTEIAHLQSSERPRLLAALGSTNGGDPADQADRRTRELELAHVDRRITRLEGRLAALADVPTPAPGGLGVGTRIVIDLGSGPETYVLAMWPEPGLPIITMGSPLGRAIREARAGQTVVFRAPGGESRVTLLAVGDPGEAAA